MNRIITGALLGAAILLAPDAARAGSEQFKVGQAAYAETCAACHGATGRGGPAYANPIWGQGARIAKFKTAEGLFEYNQLLMPFDDPTRVADETKWAILQFLLASHGAVPADGTLGPQNAAGIVVR